MYTLHIATAVRAPTSRAALPAAASPTSSTSSGVSQMQWTLAAVCGLIIGVFAVSLAVPPCVHAVKQLRQGRQQGVSGISQDPAQQCPVEGNEVFPLLLQASALPIESSLPNYQVGIDIELANRSTTHANVDENATASYRDLAAHKNQEQIHQPEHIVSTHVAQSIKDTNLAAGLFNAGALLLEPLDWLLKRSFGHSEEDGLMM